MTNDRDQLEPNHIHIASKYFVRTKSVPALLKFTVAPDGAIDLENESVEAAAFWMELLGLTHGEELTALLQQIANQAPNAASIPNTINRTLASIAAMGPKDSIELMLCVQMVAVNNMTMRVAGQSPSTFEGSGIQANALSKLSKTFASQMEALTRYRAKGQQKVTVEHLHVHQGGQVAVGTFGDQGGGVAVKNQDQPHVRQEPAQLPERPTMLGHVETVGLTLPGSSGDGLERMPVSRRAGRGASG